ncbi:ComF family protein [Streptomyces lavendulocolor]|uniref:ComF family protein n=1 Tax=Streptomyces lavendulocolor TaxID=67316 RepID=UPI0033FA894E
MTHAADLPQPLGFPKCARCPYVLTGTPEVCALCASKTIRLLAEQHCALCGQNLRTADAACWNIICGWTPEQRFFTRVDAVALFAHPLETVIKKFKYDDGNAGWGTIFGRLIVGWLNAHADEVADIDLIIGNPSAPGRTPIQHIETIMSAAYKEDSLGRWPIADPSTPVLIKTHETKKSASGGVRWTEKMEAAKEHAALKLHVPVQGKRILLVDDVFTTGATFHAVGKRLKQEARALRVRGLVLARVPG